jgi:hypothetical protein
MCVLENKRNQFSLRSPSQVPGHTVHNCVCDSACAKRVTVTVTPDSQLLRKFGTPSCKVVEFGAHRAMVRWSLCVLFLAALLCDGSLEGRSTIHGDARECECPSVDTEQDDAGKEVHLRLARSGTGIRFAWSGGHCSDAVFATCWGGLS